MRKIILFIVFTGALLLAASLPVTPQPQAMAQDDMDIVLPGLDGEVLVIYDQMGIPHIYADTTRDLFMAQGFVEASHRWWQMEWWRHQSAGRLSEIVGDQTVGTDAFLRTLSLQRGVERDYEVISEDALAYMEAYAEGVNAFLGERDPYDVALEYGFLAQAGYNVDIEPWTTDDTLRWLKVMSFDLNGNFQAEIERALLSQANPLLPGVMFPEYDFENYPVIVEPGGVDYNMDGMSATPAPNFDGAEFAFIGGVDLNDPLLNPLGSGEGLGSNSWVVSGDLTDSGMPYLANDPHLGIQMPSIWYEVGLHCNEVSEACPFDVVGVSFAGVPGIIIGHNQNIGWGFTNVGTDVQDLYMLQVNPDDPNQYMLDGEWTDFEVVVETITVNNSDPVEVPIRYSVWGPVISEVLGLPDNMVVALRWIALEPNRSIDGLFALNTAQNWEDFRYAASIFDTPAQNMVYVDVEGNIGYQTPGLTPIRAEGHDPRFPVDGSTSANAWQGYVPFDELPSVFNPEAGYIVTANNSVVGPDYPYYLTDDWAYGYRAERIEQMFQNDEDGVFSIEDLQRMQNDNYNLNADALIPALQSVEIDDPDLQDMIAWLGEWDRQNSVDSGQALLFEAFWRQLVTDIFVDDFGQFPGSGGRLWYIVDQMLQNPENPIYIMLWDDSTTPDVTEDAATIMVGALSVAIERVTGLQGADREMWQWGIEHQAIFRATPLGQGGIDPTFDPILDSLFNARIAVGGGTAIVNATSFNSDFRVTALPSFRQILVPGDWDASLRINTVGQSGIPQTRHYRDQLEMWANGEYHPDWFSRAAVEADESARWILTPQ